MPAPTTQGTACKAPRNSPSSLLPAGHLDAKVSQPTRVLLTRPTRVYQEVVFPLPEEARILSFQNHYVASMTVLRRVMVPRAEGVAPSDQWETILEDHPLMPECHGTEGSRGYFVVPLKYDAGRYRLCTGLRVYLSQPSPCWEHIEVRLEGLATYNETARLSEVIEHTQHDCRAPTDGQKSPISPSKGRRRGLAPTLSAGFSRTASETRAGDTAKTDASSHVDVMGSICAEMHGLLMQWQVGGRNGEVTSATVSAKPSLPAVEQDHEEILTLQT